MRNKIHNLIEQLIKDVADNELAEVIKEDVYNLKYLIEQYRLDKFNGTYNIPEVTWISHTEPFEHLEAINTLKPYTIYESYDGTHKVLVGIFDPIFTGTLQEAKEFVNKQNTELLSKYLVKNTR